MNTQCKAQSWIGMETWNLLVFFVNVGKQWCVFLSMLCLPCLVSRQSRIYSFFLFFSCCIGFQSGELVPKYSRSQLLLMNSGQGLTTLCISFLPVHIWSHSVRWTDALHPKIINKVSSFVSTQPECDGPVQPRTKEPDQLGEELWEIRGWWAFLLH